jgi:hypothetical protein
VHTPTILVTHSLRTYREAFAGWLRRERPALSVAECEPDAVDCARERYNPFLVICEAPTPAMRREAGSVAWIALHPAGKTASLVHLGEEERSIQDFALPDILRIVDVAEAKALLRASSALSRKD